MWQYQAFLVILLLGSAISQCVYAPAATSILWEGYLIYGKAWYATHRFGHPVGFLTDKCFKATAGIFDVKPDLSIHFPVTYFDERNNKEESITVASYIIGMQSKFYVHHNNTGFLVSDFAVTDSYIATEICDMSTGRSEVLIFTPHKKRDEELITIATEEASKIMKLPSPSMSTECESTPL